MKFTLVRLLMMTLGFLLCESAYSQTTTNDPRFNMTSYKDATVIIPETDPEIEIRIDRRDVLDYAQNIPADEKRLILKAIKAGVAKVSIYSKNDQLLRIYTVSVRDTAQADRDTQEASNVTMIKKLVDDPGLEIAFAGEEGNRMVVLQGEVEDDLVRRKALNIAQAFYPDRVLDFIQIRQPLQVRVKCQVVQVQIEDNRNVGLQYYSGSSSKGDGLSVPFGINSVNPVPRYPFFTVSNTAGTYDLQAALNLSSTLKKINVLQEPTLTVMNGQPATFLVGKRLPYPSSTSVSNGIVTQEIDFINVGISLLITPIAEGPAPGFRPGNAATPGANVPGSQPPSTESLSERGVGKMITDSRNSISPTIERNGIVKLFVKPEVSVPDFNSVRVSGVPDVDIKFVETRVALRNNQSMILSGLFDDTTTRMLEKVPFIADIPVLGEFFKNRNDEKLKNELVFILTPEIILPEKIVKGDTVSPRLSEMAQHMNDYGLTKFMEPVKPTRISAAEIYVRKGEAAPVLVTPRQEEASQPADNSQAQPLVPLRQGSTTP